MSLNLYETEQYSRRVPTEVPSRMKTLVNLLCSQTSASIYSVVSDTEDAYDVIISVGGNRAARMTGLIGESSVSVSMAIGYLDGEAFAETKKISSESNASATTYSNSLAVINGSGWDICNRDSDDNIHVRVIKFISSINNQPTWSCGIYKTSSPYESFPSKDYILNDGTDYSIQYSTAEEAAGNVPAGKIMLFPSLLTIEARNYLGSPTIGNQRPYMIISPNGVSLTAFSEFNIDIARFISLGGVAIRSE